MAELLIPYKGKVYRCQYDQEDEAVIKQYTWHLINGYATTFIKGKAILFHRLVMKVEDPEKQVDHRFHDKLDNRKAMLRVCTRAENRRNSQKHKATAHSKFKGIYNDQGRWHAQIMQDGKVKNLGRNSSEIMAAKLYDQRALEIFKDFAFINFQSSREARQLTFAWW